MTNRDRQVDESRKAKRLKYLQEKHKDTDRIYEEKPLYYFSKFIKTVIQLGCALLASCGVISLVSDFTDNPYIVSSIAIGVLFLIELVIHLSGTKVALAKIKGKKQNFRIVLSLAVCILFSFGSTYLGADSTVSYFIQPASLVDTKAIESDYQQKIADNSINWGQKSKEYEDKAKEVHEKMNYKGVTVRGAQAIHTQLEESAAAMKDSLISYESALRASLSTALFVANEENKTIQQAHEEKVGFYSHSLKWVSLVGYALVFLFMLFIEDHEIREEEYLLLETEQESSSGESATDESRAPKQTQNKQTERTKNRTEQAEQAGKASVSAESEQTKIGFNKLEHGRVFYPEGSTEPRVQYRTKRGKWTDYRICDLNKMIKKPDGSKEWKDELRTLKTKLEHELQK